MKASTPAAQSIAMTLHTLLAIAAKDYERMSPEARKERIQDLALSEARSAMEKMIQPVQLLDFALGQCRVYAPSQARAIWVIDGYAIRADVLIKTKDAVRGDQDEHSGRADRQIADLR